MTSGNLSLLSVEHNFLASTPIDITQTINSVYSFTNNKTTTNALVIDSDSAKITINSPGTYRIVFSLFFRGTGNTVSQTRISSGPLTNLTLVTHYLFNADVRSNILWTAVLPILITLTSANLPYGFRAACTRTGNQTLLNLTNVSITSVQ